MRQRKIRNNMCTITVVVLLFQPPRSRHSPHSLHLLRLMGRPWAVAVWAFKCSPRLKVLLHRGQLICSSAQVEVNFSPFSVLYFSLSWEWVRKTYVLVWISSCFYCLFPSFLSDFNDEHWVLTKSGSWGPDGRGKNPSLVCLCGSCSLQCLRTVVDNEEFWVVALSYSDNDIVWVLWDIVRAINCIRRLTVCLEFF